MTERIVRILREEYKDAGKERDAAYQRLGEIQGDPESGVEQRNLTHRVARNIGRIEAVGNIVEKINEELDTNLRKDATKNPRKKRNESAD